MLGCPLFRKEFFFPGLCWYCCMRYASLCPRPSFIRAGISFSRDFVRVMYYLISLLFPFFLRCVERLVSSPFRHCPSVHCSAVFKCPRLSSSSTFHFYAVLKKVKVLYILPFPRFSCVLNIYYRRFFVTTLKNTFPAYDSISTFILYNSVKYNVSFPVVGCVEKLISSRFNRCCLPCFRKTPSKVRFYQHVHIQLPHGDRPVSCGEQVQRHRVPCGRALAPGVACPGDRPGTCRIPYTVCHIPGTGSGTRTATPFTMCCMWFLPCAAYRLPYPCT